MSVPIVNLKYGLQQVLKRSRDNDTEEEICNKKEKVGEEEYNENDSYNEENGYEVQYLGVFPSDNKT